MTSPPACPVTTEEAALLKTALAVLIVKKRLAQDHATSTTQILHTSKCLTAQSSSTGRTKGWQSHCDYLMRMALAQQQQQQTPLLEHNGGTTSALAFHLATQIVDVTTLQQTMLEHNEEDNDDNSDTNNNDNVDEQQPNQDRKSKERNQDEIAVSDWLEQWIYHSFCNVDSASNNSMTTVVQLWKSIIMARPEDMSILLLPVVTSFILYLLSTDKDGNNYARHESSALPTSPSSMTAAVLRLLEQLYMVIPQDSLVLGQSLQALDRYTLPILSMKQLQCSIESMSKPETMTLSQLLVQSALPHMLQTIMHKRQVTMEE